LGLDNDPRGVFSIATVDGEPAIHVTGEVWGALISVDEYDDFELELQFKWGPGPSWPPNNFKDSGIMYLSHGPYGAVDIQNSAMLGPIGAGAFMVSTEYQLVSGDIGDAYHLGAMNFTPVPFVRGSEAPGWNDVRIVLTNGTATHYLGGTAVSGGSNFVNTWPGMGQMGDPVTRGRFQLQSEGGDIYFRHVRVRRL
jgi:hypothetical protein